jgi:hypothetical protein
VRYFVAELAIAIKLFRKKKILWIVCGIRALKEMAIYAILKKVRPEKKH